MGGAAFRAAEEPLVRFHIHLCQTSLPPQVLIQGPPHKVWCVVSNEAIRQRQLLGVTLDHRGREGISPRVRKDLLEAAQRKESCRI